MQVTHKLTIQISTCIQVYRQYGPPYVGVDPNVYYEYHTPKSGISSSTYMWKTQTGTCSKQCGTGNSNVRLQTNVSFHSFAIGFHCIYGLQNIEICIICTSSFITAYSIVFFCKDSFLVHFITLINVSPYLQSVQFIFYFWSFEISRNILKNQKTLSV